MTRQQRSGGEKDERLVHLVEEGQTTALCGATVEQGDDSDVTATAGRDRCAYCLAIAAKGRGKGT